MIPLAPARSLRRDRQADRSVARLRLASALIVGTATSILALGPGGPIRGLFVALGILFSLGWMLAYRRSHSSANDQDHLRWDRHGIDIHVGKTQWSLPWVDIHTVEADEDRLCVRVLTASNERAIPLVWKGVGLYELAEELNAARTSAKMRAKNGHD